MQFDAEVESFIERSIRRGLATWGEITRLGEERGVYTADAVAERLQTAGVRLANDRDLGVTAQTNPLMNDLTLIELVSLCLQLPVAPRLLRRLHQNVIRRRSYELDLQRLEYLDGDHEYYYLSHPFNRLQRSIRQVFDSGQIPFARRWHESDMKTNASYLGCLVADPAFAAQILPQIQGHYLQLTPIRLLVAWMKATGKQQPTMADILQAGLQLDGDEAVRQVLLADQPSTAGSALESRRDVCFTCPPWGCCAPLRNVNDRYPVLMAYRTAHLRSLLASRYPGQSLGECLVADGLIAKFFLPYSIVVSSKRWMVDCGIVGCESGLLDKSHGRYCPHADSWTLVSHS